MARTVIGVNDPKAIKRYSAFLATDTRAKSYFTKKMMGKGAESSMPIQELTELESDAGEYISFDLTMQMKMEPVQGDDVLENREEALKFYTDGVFIDQLRGGVNTGGRMTRKRTIHNLRKVARKRQSDWWARVFDEIFFMYIAGARGVNADYVWNTAFTGFANNAFSAPDTDHLQIANGKTKATLLVTDVMTLAELDKALTYCEMMGGGSGGGTAGTDGNTQTPQIQPIMINGEPHYVIVMNPYQEYDLRTATSTGQWLDIQKAAAGAEGRKSPIFRGGLGMYNNLVLHKHKKAVRFSDYGAGTDIEACRAMVLGEQAAVVAFGSEGTGLRFGWHEETRDNGNQVVITSSTICGVKKVTFNGKDYGAYAIDTAAKAP